MKKRVDKASKDKSDVVAQLKSLFALYSEQRKALQVSIAKSKRLEEECQRVEAKQGAWEETQKGQARRIEQLE
jgi:chromosome segregation ATPase